METLKIRRITWVLQDAGLKEISENFQKIPAKNFSIF